VQPRTRAYFSGRVGCLIVEQVHCCVGPPRLSRCTAEFSCRYNTRDLTDGERASVILKGGEGRRLTYRRINRLPA